MHLWRRLGIIQVNLASALALHKRSFLTGVFLWHFRLCSAIPVNLIALTCTTFQGTSEQYSFWHTLFYFANCPPWQGRFLTQFFPLENLSTFQLLPYPFVYKRLTAERLGAPTIHWWRVWGWRGFIRRLYFTCFSALLFRFFKGHFYFPTIAGKAHHNCGAASPQLWGRYTTVVGQ